jgi:hypothetical protein
MQYHLMNTGSRYCLLLLLGGILGGCMTTRHAVEANDQSLPLLSPAVLSASHQVNQVLHGEYGDQSFNLRCVVTANAEKLSVICLTGMGLRAFTLTYDGKNLTEQRASQVPASLQATRLLNDLQLAFWPLNELQKSWTGAGLQVTEPYPGTRRVMRNSKIVVEVHYSSDPWQGRVWLHQNELGYGLFIESSVME